MCLKEFFLGGVSDTHLNSCNIQPIKCDENTLIMSQNQLLERVPLFLSERVYRGSLLLLLEIPIFLPDNITCIIQAFLGLITQTPHDRVFFLSFPINKACIIQHNSRILYGIHTFISLYDNKTSYKIIKKSVDWYSKIAVYLYS